MRTTRELALFHFEAVKTIHVEPEVMDSYTGFPCESMESKVRMMERASVRSESDGFMICFFAVRRLGVSLKPFTNVSPEVNGISTYMDVLANRCIAAFVHFISLVSEKIWSKRELYASTCISGRRIVPHFALISFHVGRYFGVISCCQTHAMAISCERPKEICFIENLLMFCVFYIITYATDILKFFQISS